MMTHSDQLAELATALAKAQGQIKEAKRDETNPAIRNGYRYASLSSVWEACREALSVNGLSVVQSPGYEGDDVVIVQTLLLHTSGQWIASELTMPLEQDGALRT